MKVKRGDIEVKPSPNKREIELLFKLGFPGANWKKLTLTVSEFDQLIELQRNVREQLKETNNAST